MSVVMRFDRNGICMPTVPSKPVALSRRAAANAGHSVARRVLWDAEGVRALAAPGSAS